jgi:hypothetical protein
MNIGEILIWESTNLLLLIPVVLGLVIASRWRKGQPVLTDRDWRFLFGHPREEVFTGDCGCALPCSGWLWCWWAWGIVFYVLPFSVWWFGGAVLLAIAGIPFITPRWLR